MMEVNYRNEKRIMRIVNADDLSVERKISKLTIMALKAFPSSPMQNAISAARADLQATRS